MAKTCDRHVKPVYALSAWLPALIRCSQSIEPIDVVPCNASWQSSQHTTCSSDAEETTYFEV